MACAVRTDSGTDGGTTGRTDGAGEDSAPVSLRPSRAAGSADKQRRSAGLERGI